MKSLAAWGLLSALGTKKQYADRIKISVLLWLSTTILLECESPVAVSLLPWCISKKAGCISHFRGAFWEEAWCIDRNRGASAGNGNA